MTQKQNTAEYGSGATHGSITGLRIFSMGLALSLAILLVGCNDSDDDDGDDIGDPAAVAPPIDGSNSGGQDPSKLQAVTPAEFVSTDAVAMMAPGSLFTTSSVGLAYYQFLSRRTGSPEEPQACDEGRIVVINDELRDVASPYSGALFDVQTTDAQNCIASYESQDDPVTVFVTEGQSSKGYPTEGDGSNSDQNTFIAYERFGTSLEDPFNEDISEPEEEFDIEWLRLSDSHVEIKHDPDPAAPFGSASGDSRLSDISLYTSKSGEEQGTQRLQLGDPRVPVNYMQFSFSPFDGQDPDESRQEEYNGLYGREIVTINDEPAPESCTLGRFQVSTLQPLITQRLPDDEEPGVWTSVGELQSGVLQMIDDFGNEATVTYDGAGDTMTVALNNGPSQTYTYEEVDQLFITNCELE